jgi:NADH:ubiquinone oxidoreductase subunit F (NADH-binding)/(2Fe-2S) ferredoxin
MSNKQYKVLIGLGTCGISVGAEQVFLAFERELSEHNVKESIQVKRTGCQGFCQQEPLVIVEPVGIDSQREGIFYTKVKLDDVTEIIKSLLPEGKPLDRLFYRDPITNKPIPYYHEIPFYSKQERTILMNCGRIDPENIDDYLSVGGYKALRKALFEMTPVDVISEVKSSGIRGLGGAGFPTGRKWETCRNAPREKKYVICNADEGDPGAFQDRSVMEGNPHSVIEGMIIAAYAIGAQNGFIYVRAEYPLAVSRLKIAIEQARQEGVLGDHILDSDFNFDIEIFKGAGAFVCGESTALVRSIEGKRGRPKPMPRARTTEIGLWNRPTLLNNVKTFANIPLIISNGSEWFSKRGTEKSKGTAVFSLTGKVVNCGLIEVPMGVTLQKIIFDIGGGIPGGKALKAVQTGGPSGGCLPANMIDMPVDFDSLTKAGSIMGSGGMVVMDEDTCMVDVARYFLDFTQRESCGQCIPCRLGTVQMFKILDDITKGNGRTGDIDLLLELSEAIKRSSICGLGKTAPNPVLTTLRYFRDEYEAHIHEKRCPAGVCMVQEECD